MQIPWLPLGVFSCDLDQLSSFSGCVLEILELWFLILLLPGQTQHNV